MMEAWLHEDYYATSGEDNSSSSEDVLENGGGSASGASSPLPVATASAMRTGADMRAHSTIKAFVQQLTVPLSSPSPPPLPLPLPLPSTSTPEEPVSNSDSSGSSLDSIHSCRCSHEEEDEDEFEDVDLEAGDACSTTNATLGEDDDEQEEEKGRAICLICYEELPMEEKLPRTMPSSSSSSSCRSSSSTTTITTTIAAASFRSLSPPLRAASSSTCASSSPSSAQYCPHSYCGRCMKAYLETRIHEGRAEHPCPMRGDAGCNFVFGDDHLQELIDPSTLAEHHHRAILRAQPSLRECPSCHTLVKGGSKRRPSLTCPSCGLKFCFFHATAHAMEGEEGGEGGRGGCRRYTRLMRAVERASASMVKRISKPCPKCKAPIEKDGGCNHISCVSCRYEWCWLCEQRYTPFHYSPTNIFGCPGAQFVDFGRGSQGCCCGFSAPLCRLFRVLVASILLPPPLLLGVVVALLATVLWLPIGVGWACLAKLLAGSPAAVSCLGGQWEMLDLIFPLVSGSRAFRQGNGAMGLVYVFIFLGSAPLVLSASLLLQVLWMPFAMLVLVVRASRRRRLRLSFIFAPMLLATHFLDLDGE